MTRTANAHLNGGPMDDEYIAVQGLDLRVRRLEPLNLQELPAEPTVLGFREGAYRPRLTELGHRVPHDLYGTEEWDWVGWL